MGVFSNVKASNGGSSPSGHNLKIGKVSYRGNGESTVSIHFPKTPILCTITQTNEGFDYGGTNLFDPMAGYCMVISAFTEVSMTYTNYTGSNNTLTISNENGVLNDTTTDYEVIYFYED